MQPPLGGVNRRYDFQGQPPFTTPDASNVLSRGLSTGRMRIARRPSLSKYSSTELGDGADVRFLGVVTTVESLSSFTMTEPYSGTMETDGWLTSGYDSTDFVSRSVSEKITTHKTSAAAFAAVLNQPSGIEMTQEYTVEFRPKLKSTDSAMYLATGPEYATSIGNTLTSPATYGTKMCLVTLTRTTITVKDYDGASTSTRYTGAITFVDYAPVTITVSGTTVTVSYNGTVLVTYTTLSVTGLPYATAAVRFGNTSGSSMGPVTIRYSGVTFVAPKRYLLAGAGQKVYRQETPTSTPQQITTSTRNIALKHRLRCVEMFGKLYVADYTVTRLSDISDGSVSGSVLTSAAITALGGWGTIGDAAKDTAIDVKSDLVLLTKGTNQYQAEISSIAGNNLNLSWGGRPAAPNDSGYTVVIARGVKVIDPSANSITNLLPPNGFSGTTATGSTGTALKAAVATFAKTDVGKSVRFHTSGNLYVIASYTNSTTVTLTESLATEDTYVTAGKYFYEPVGVVPMNCSLITVMWDRLILAGDETNAFYMSAVGDPTDWLYGDTTKGSDAAFGGASETRAKVASIPTALVPYGDDTLVIACADSLWSIRGDPLSGGSMVNLSRVSGCISGDAFCLLPDGSMLHLARDGLYILPPGAVFSSGDSSITTPFSKEVVPVELKQIDPDNYTVQMVYDIAYDGVWLFVTPESESTGAHWFIRWSDKALWPIPIQPDHGPTACGVDANGNAIVGGRDGYLRKWDALATTDDGEPVTGTCLLGPFMCARPGRDGLVQEIVGTLPAASADLTWSLKVGKTIEEALAAEATNTGTWIAGRNRPKRVRARGAVAFLELSGTGLWEFESGELVLDEFGRLRF